MLLSIYKYLKYNYRLLKKVLPIKDYYTIKCKVYYFTPCSNVAVSYLKKEGILGGRNHIPHSTSPSVKSKIELPFYTYLLAQGT